MLVEDEHGIRRLLRRVLEREGYRILEAGRGDLAVSAAEASTSPIDVLVTDVLLPDVSGFQLARWARGLHAATKVIYMSGYARNDFEEMEGADPTAAFIQKPFSPESLSELVRKVTEEPPQ